MRGYLRKKRGDFGAINVTFYLGDILMGTGRGILRLENWKIVLRKGGGEA